MGNPYQTPNAVASNRSEIIRPGWLDWLFWGVALLPAASVYFTWLVAWITLGHPPRPSLDDPSHISPAVNIIYFVSGLLLLSLPVFVIVGPIVQLVVTGRLLAIRVAYAAISFFVSVGTILLLRWDPYDVVYWYFD